MSSAVETFCTSKIMWKKRIICNAVIACYIICLSKSSTLENYGKFLLKITDFDICKGPKQRECTNMTAKVINGTNLILDVHIRKDVIPNRGKIEAMMNSQPLLRLQMKNPCDHLFMKPLFQKILNVTENCEFKKGHYIINIDIEDVAKKYYGGMFLYGNLTFKSVFYNDDCNYSCALIKVSFYPQDNAKH